MINLLIVLINFQIWNQVLRERGQGSGILVSKIPKDTNASYSLQEPSEVIIFRGI